MHDSCEAVTPTPLDAVEAKIEQSCFSLVLAFDLFELDGAQLKKLVVCSFPSLLSELPLSEG